MGHIRFRRGFLVCEWSYGTVYGQSAACTDVRCVIRTVFREIDALPPLSVEDALPEDAAPAVPGAKQMLPNVDHWVEKCRSEGKKILDHEDEIKHQHAKRIARAPLPNIHKLRQPRRKEVPAWRLDRGLIDRKDLKPPIDQNAGCDESLWVKNILNASSCDVSTVKFAAAQPAAPVVLPPWKEISVQSLSIGEVMPHPTPHVTVPPTPESVQYILCVPPRLDFINCVAGNSYMQTIRLINISKFECRVSVTPPKRRVLHVELHGSRGLAVSSGASMELRLHFTPMDVRALYDELVVRVSCGQAFTLPIACYIEPPMLDFEIPALSFPALPGAERQSVDSLSANDVLELGARLLGDEHCVRVTLICNAEHAVFFVLTEEAWIESNIDCLSDVGSVVAGSFVWWPAWWRGGGAVRACAWCRGTGAGAHAAALRVLSSTATTRTVFLLADVLMFTPRHLTIKAHEKDFDICGDDDVGCEYYVNLGDAFPHRALSATVQLINSSSVVYNYYWDVRRWGICLCWEDETASLGSQTSVEPEERMCIGALRTKHMDPETLAKKTEDSHVVQVEPAEGRIMPRTTSTLRVRVPDVGGELGVQRSVLRLIVKDIPKESISKEYASMILRTKQVLSTPIHGVKSYMREVCDVVCAQMEVWWEVAPLRFVLEPALMILHHSRRLDSIAVNINACQLFGSDACRLSWSTPPRVVPPPPLALSASQFVVTSLTLPLPELPNHCPETDIISLVAENNEWQADCVITRQCETRHPSLSPARAWLGIIPPGTRVRTIFTITNDTYQQIYFWCDVYRWLGENKPGAACLGKIPCENCQQFTCTCAILKPTRGGLADGESRNIHYNVNAPERDGCVMTLVQARRCGADAARAPGGAGTEARAALVAYRVLAPRVTARLLPCGGGSDCSECGLDPGAARHTSGTAMLRPSQELVLGRRTCYRLLITNITPIPTAVQFDKPIDGTDELNVKFTPNRFTLSGYADQEVRVVVEALKVCARRIFVYRAVVKRAYKPLYIVIDAAVSGLKISCQVPLGGVTQDDFVIVRRTQKIKQTNPLKEGKGTPNEIFTEEDRQRVLVKEECHCHVKLTYIPPVKRPLPPPQSEDDYRPPEIVTEPPPKTRVCRCYPHSKPFIPEMPESTSLEFINMSVRKVYKRRLVLRNESLLTAYWTTAVRRWPRQNIRTLDKDKWSCGVRAPGVALECRPPRGVLPALAQVEIYVHVYADSWGLYWDQILIQVDKVEPIVLDVWMQVIAPPLQFKLQPRYASDDLPVLWVSTSDPTHSLGVKNVSRSELDVYAYVTHENERIEDILPFRLYLRMFDVLPATCPCVTAYNSDVGEQSETSSLAIIDMDTGVELYLAEDHGLQDDNLYKVTPEQSSIKPGEWKDWEVTLIPPPPSEPSRDATLLLRTVPVDKSGEGWYRSEPAPQLVRIYLMAREPRVKLSCDEIIVGICAMDLPYKDFVRIRKRFFVINVGNGSCEVCMHTSTPWCIVQGHHTREDCANSEASSYDEQRNALVYMQLPPTSSTEVCVEVCISTIEACPTKSGSEHAPHNYEPKRQLETTLHVYDNYQVILTLPLILKIEYPVIQLSPRSFDFGFVTDGNTRKTFITVSHTSPTNTLVLNVKWIGCDEFKWWPPRLEIPPAGRVNLYVQYTAVWRHGPAEGCVVVSADAAWCRAAAPVRATPTLDYKWCTDLHDHTDDTHLMPKRVQHYISK